METRIYQWIYCIYQMAFLALAVGQFSCECASYVTAGGFLLGAVPFTAVYIGNCCDSHLAKILAMTVVVCFTTATFSYVVTYLDDTAAYVTISFGLSVFNWTVVFTQSWLDAFTTARSKTGPFPSPSPPRSSLSSRLTPPPSPSDSIFLEAPPVYDSTTVDATKAKSPYGATVVAIDRD